MVNPSSTLPRRMVMVVPVPNVSLDPWADSSKELPVGHLSVRAVKAAADMAMTSVVAAIERPWGWFVRSLVN